MPLARGGGGRCARDYSVSSPPLCGVSGSPRPPRPRFPPLPQSSCKTSPAGSSRSSLIQRATRGNKINRGCVSTSLAMRASCCCRVASVPRALPMVRALPVPVRHPRVLRAVQDSKARLISATEIPAFIPRDDLMDQVSRWAEVECATNGMVNFGLPMTVESTFRDEDGEPVLWGIRVCILRNGETVAEMAFRFDDRHSEQAQFLDMDPETGMPVRAGEIKQVPGKNFEIVKLDQRPVDEELRAVIRRLCGGMADALNKYYAFGSVFSEEL